MTDVKSSNLNKISLSGNKTLEIVVTSNIEENNKNKKNLKKNNSQDCICAKKFAKIGDAYEAFEAGKDVFVVKEKDSSYKSYGKCSISRKDGEEYCSRHIHQKDKILFQDLVNNTHGNCERITNIKHKYLEKMGSNQGRKKDLNTKKKPVIKFLQIDDPIYLAYTHPNKNYKKCLMDCAKFIIENGITNKSTYNIRLNAGNNNTTSTSSLMNNDEDEDEDEDDDARETNKKVSQTNIKDESDEEEDEEDVDDNSTETRSCSSEEDNDSDEEEEDNDYDFIDISPKNDDTKSFKLNRKSMKVYEKISQDDDDDEEGVEEIGEMIEIAKKYSTIVFEDSEYIIAKEISDEEKGLDMYLCILTDKVFNKETKNCLGKLKRNKKGEPISISYRSDK